MSDSDDFCSVYPRVYLAFHRRDGRRSELTNASRAVLTHLIGSGPITIGEAALHLDRAQSVVSEIVNQLQGHGLVAREPDPADRRRTLVWLTDTGLARLRDDSDVLDRTLVEQAMQRLDDTTRRGLVEGLSALVAAAQRKES